jgi:hypothetical protein
MRLATIIAVLSALLLAGQASAKEIKSAAVCGASGCERQAGSPRLQWLAQVGDRAEPPGTAPFYTVSVVVAEPNGTRATLRSIYVPSKHRVGAKPDGSDTVTWFEALPQYAAALDRIAPQVKPFAASRFPSSPTSLAPRAVAEPAHRAWPWIVLTAAAGITLLAAAALGLARRGRLGRQYRRDIDPAAHHG